jgi:hypothetical protein
MGGSVFFDGDCKNLPLVGEIASMMPNSKFIHLIRRPVDFVLSGLNRGYYKEKAPQMWGHLEDVPAHGASLSTSEQVRKIATFWNMANEIAEGVRGTIGDDRLCTIRAEDMFSDPDVVIEALGYLGLSRHFRHVRSRGKPEIRHLNQQRKRLSPSPDLLRSIDRAIEQCCPTRSLYYPDTGRSESPEDHQPAAGKVGLRNGQEVGCAGR